MQFSFHRFSQNHSKRRGFTLLELLAVLTILAIVIAVTAPAINSRIQKGKTNAAKVQINAISQSLNAFNLECGFFPSTEQGLDALISAPTVGRTCKTYDPAGYWEKKELPRDPWNSPYNYGAPGTHNNPYDLSSNGPDGVAGNEDDIKSWE